MWKSLKRWPVLSQIRDSPMSARRKYLLLSVLAAGLVWVTAGGLAVGLVFLPREDRVTANCERIKKGMTEAEVRAILGKPWENSWLDPEGPTYSDACWVLHSLADLPPWVQRKCTHNHFWFGDNIGLFVAFDDDGRVACAVLFADPDRPRTWLPQRVWRRLRDRYGW